MTAVTSHLMYSVKNPEGRVSKDDNHPFPLISSLSIKIRQEEKEKKLFKKSGKKKKGLLSDSKEPNA